MLREDGTPCAPDEPGELVHRGALVGMGYWNDPEKTAERYKPLPGARAAGLVLPEIAVFSGDTVRTDEDGFLYFIGRRDEMIKTSGYRVSPTEVEEVLYGTQLVGEAAAFGVPHPSARPGDRRHRDAAAPVRQLDADDAARRMPRAPARLHGAGEDRDPRRPAAAQSQRQDRSQGAGRGIPAIVRARRLSASHRTSPRESPSCRMGVSLNRRDQNA